MHDRIIIKGARQHNLKNITLEIPKNKLVVLTGLSGSGKSSLAFDTLHKEGQRQYMESLGLVDYMSKPKLDAIQGLSPTISVDQHVVNRSPRSTVGTATEVYTFLRVLYARIGQRCCTACGGEVPPAYDVNGDSAAWDDEPGDTEPGEALDAATTYPCPHCGQPMPELGMAHFSFNKPDGACPTCTGLGIVRTGNLELLLDPERSILDGGVVKWDRYEVARYSEALRAAGQHYGFVFDPAAPIKMLGQAQRDLLLYGVHSSAFCRHYPNTKAPELAALGRFEGVVTNLLRRYQEHVNNPAYREALDEVLVKAVCPECNGERLRLESRQVTVDGQNIVSVAALPIVDLADWLARLPQVVSPQGWIVAEPIVAGLNERVRHLIDVGVGYLSLERATPSLSAGEAQRLRLAALLGSGLTGVMYVLDEPTIGLHQRDTDRLIKVLRQLRDLDNTVLVIEHDLDMVRAADYVIEMGPGGGENGGHVVVAGPPETISAHVGSATGDYLSGRLSIERPAQRRVGNGKRLVIQGARAHNLKNVTAILPLGLLIAVTGVSGSGKSSLMLDTLDRAARQRFYAASDAPGPHDAILGWEHLDKIITIDQSAIGRTPRSNAATYTDAFTPIRQVFAATPQAKASGLAAHHFSFNVPGGRCERCEGAGLLTIQMHFLPDVQVRCPACHGRRFKREVLAVRYQGHSIADVLDMTIEQAQAVFKGVSSVDARLALMMDVGLGYLKLGQPATTLSGGEAQRVKLAKELARRATGRTLYMLDEPTTGLHVADVACLLVVLQRLVDAGNSVVVIEHNLDVVKVADWVIDLGPEGGQAGGQIVAQGAPEQIAQASASHTGDFLRRLL